MKIADLKVGQVLFGPRACYFCRKTEEQGHAADCEHPRAIAARKRAAKEAK